MRSLLCLIPLLVVSAARADTADPLALVPDAANLVIRIEKPRLLVESLVNHDLFREMKQMPFVREQLESPQVQRFLQLVAYYEDDLGAKWPELLDKAAGGGITIATKISEGDPPVAMIVHGTDPAFSKKLYTLAVNVLEQEAAREESKVKPKKGTYRGIDGVRFDNLWIAPVGANLYFATNEKAMQLALDLHLDKKASSLTKKNGPAEARKALPANSMAWLWLDLDVARSAPNTKNFYTLPSNDLIQTLILGSTWNAIGRAPFLAVGLHREKDTYGVTFRMPGGGRTGMPEAMALHIPSKGHGTLPLLEPEGVLASHALYLDFKAMWELRSKLFNEKIAKDFEQGLKQASPFVPGGSLEKLFASSGPFHRFVAAHRPPPPGYATKPGQYYPAMAFVTQMRDPQFGKSADGLIRAGALLAGAQIGLKMFDETRGGVKIVGYRFPEDKPFPNDPENLRFAFTPCFATVNDQFLMCSTVEFAREMVDLLQKESLSSRTRTHPAALRTKFYAAGGAALLKAFEEQVLGQIILGQAVKPAEAQAQAEQLMKWIRRLGTVELQHGYLDNEFRFDVEWTARKQ